MQYTPHASFVMGKSIFGGDNKVTMWKKLVNWIVKSKAMMKGTPAWWAFDYYFAANGK